MRKRIVFTGRVQGVGFRYRATQLARRLDLSGWVENESNGSVLMEVQGSDEAIDKLLVGINGSPYIVIDWQETTVIPPIAETSFYIK